MLFYAVGLYFKRFRFVLIKMAGIQQVFLKLTSSITGAGFLQSSRFLAASTSKFSSSSRRLMETGEMVDMDEEETGPVPLRNLYVNQVTLVGDVTQAPRPLGGDGNTVGYAINVQTKRRFRTADGMRESKTTHNVVTFMRNQLAMVENLNVNDRVMVRGSISRYMPPHTMSLTLPDEEELGSGGIVQVRSSMIEKLAPK